MSAAMHGFNDRHVTVIRISASELTRDVDEAADALVRMAAEKR
jgi:hypothetical protein